MRENSSIEIFRLLQSREHLSMKYEAESLDVGVQNLMELASLLRTAQLEIRRDRSAAIELIGDAIGRLSGGDELELVSSPMSPERTRPRSRLAPWQERAARRHVNTSLDTISVCELASRVQLSKSYFSRAFRNSFGQSPGAYIRAVRVDASKAAMIGSRDALAQIALACGFSDQAHFSRVFRAETGHTPGAWRRHHATH
jgi:AraC-like DNA-binding protein